MIRCAVDRIAMLRSCPHNGRTTQPATFSPVFQSCVYIAQPIVHSNCNKHKHTHTHLHKHKKRTLTHSNIGLSPIPMPSARTVNTLCTAPSSTAGKTALKRWQTHQVTHTHTHGLHTCVGVCVCASLCNIRHFGSVRFGARLQLASMHNAIENSSAARPRFGVCWHLCNDMSVYYIRARIRCRAGSSSFALPTLCGAWPRDQADQRGSARTYERSTYARVCVFALRIMEAVWSEIVRVNE